MILPSPRRPASPAAIETRCLLKSIEVTFRTVPALPYGKG